MYATTVVVPKQDFEQIRAELEDAQESLAAAFARIEVFRLREKQLVAEIAKLRLGDKGFAGKAEADAPPAAAAQHPAEQQQQQQAGTEPSQTSTSGRPSDSPAYVTEVQGHLPVMLVNGNTGRKTPGSIVITPGFVDFVEIRARVKRREFVGFTSVSPDSIKPQTPAKPAAKWKQLFTTCLTTPDSGSPRVQDKAQRQAGAAWIAPPAETHTSSAVSSSAVTCAETPASMANGVIDSYVSSSAAEAAARGDQQQQQLHSVISPSAQSHQDAAGSSGLGFSRPQSPHMHHSNEATSSSNSKTGLWQILWQGGGQQQQLSFEATHETRQLLHRHTARWLRGSSSGGRAAEEQEGSGSAAAGAAAAVWSTPTADGAIELAVPRHLSPGSFTPKLSEHSAILASTNDRSINNDGASSNNSSSNGQLVNGLRHIAAALPARYQRRDWTLLYSTGRHGISLQTLYRKAAGVSGTVLLVRDAGGYVFGAFCSEAWRPCPRFFGTGETLVFQLSPHKVVYPWKVKSHMKNDFFLYAQPESLGVGGLGAFAIWLDAELLQGSSGSCGTFGSPCLASREDFKVSAVELWGLTQ